jgi:hypothetical protein
VLDYLAGVHHHDVVGAASDHSHVVGDEDHGHAKLGLELVEQLENLGLDRNVEGRGGLVENHELRVA